MSNRPTGNLVSSALLGAASGILSQSGVATVILRTPPEQLPRWLRSPWAKRVAGVFAAGEVVANATISALPARSKEGLPGRLIMGAASAALDAKTRNEPLAMPAAVGAVAGVASALAITPVRAALGKRIPDPLVALGETVVAFGLATLAVRRQPDRGNTSG